MCICVNTPTVRKENKVIAANIALFNQRATVFTAAERIIIATIRHFQSFLQMVTPVSEIKIILLRKFFRKNVKSLFYIKEMIICLVLYII